MKRNKNHIQQSDRLNSAKDYNKNELQTMRKNFKECVHAYNVSALLKSLNNAMSSQANHEDLLRKLNIKDAEIHRLQKQNAAKRKAMAINDRTNSAWSSNDMEKLTKQNENFVDLAKHNARKRIVLTRQNAEDKRMINRLNKQIAEKNDKLHKFNQNFIKLVNEQRIQSDDQQKQINKMKTKLLKAKEKEVTRLRELLVIQSRISNDIAEIVQQANEAIDEQRLAMTTSETEKKLQVIGSRRESEEMEVCRLIKENKLFHPYRREMGTILTAILAIIVIFGYLYMISSNFKYYTKGKEIKEFVMASFAEKIAPAPNSVFVYLLDLFEEHVTAITLSMCSACIAYGLFKRARGHGKKKRKRRKGRLSSR